MIEEVHFQNFKCLRDVCLDLAQLTVIVGRNASGKTTVLEGMHYLAKIAQNADDLKLDYLFRGHKTLDALYSENQDDQHLILACNSGSDEFRFRATRFPDDGGADVWNQNGDHWFWRVEGKAFETENMAKKTIARTGYYDLTSSYLARPSLAEDEIPSMTHTGEGLASVIANMILSSPEDFQNLLKMLQRIVPNLLKIRVQKKKILKIEKETVSIRGQSITSRVPRTVVGDTLVFDFANRKDVSALNVSDGTLLVLGILALIYNPNRPEVILLDDIDKGLHPMAQTEMVEILRQLLSLFPDIQIVATTHSPYWVDSLTSAEVRLMTLDDCGDSVLGNLEDHPEFERWKKEMAPGELWSVFGESWLTKKAEK